MPCSPRLSAFARFAVLCSITLLFLAGCSDDDDTSFAPGPQPDPELFDRFEAELLLDESVLGSMPTQVRFFPNDPGRALITHQSGRVSLVTTDGETAALVGTFEIPGVDLQPGELGLTDVIFDPGFATNGFVYFAYAPGDNTVHRVVRLTWDDDLGSVASTVQTVIEFSRGEPEHPWHSIHAMAFDAAGALLVSVGDATQRHLAQDPMSLNGKLLRIRPLAAGGYEIPADNPHVGDDGVLDEIVALGLRSPFRMTRWLDHVYIGDVGSTSEEINHYGGVAANFGWPLCSGPCGREGFIDPVLAVAQDDPTFVDQDPSDYATTQKSIGVGVVYDMPDADPYEDLLDGHLVFYDIFKGWVRAAEVRPDGQLGPSTHIAHIRSIGGMNVGVDGAIYAVQLFPPSLLRVVLKPEEE